MGLLKFKWLWRMEFKFFAHCVRNSHAHLQVDKLLKSITTNEYNIKYSLSFAKEVEEFDPNDYFCFDLQVSCKWLLFSYKYQRSQCNISLLRLPRFRDLLINTFISHLLLRFIKIILFVLHCDSSTFICIINSNAFILFEILCCSMLCCCKVLQIATSSLHFHFFFQTI